MFSVFEEILFEFTLKNCISISSAYPTNSENLRVI